MAQEVSGIPLTVFEDPIREALHQYAERTDGLVGFDADSAARLILTPDKPNSARSETAVRHGNAEDVARLFVVAFRPDDGTGANGVYQLSDLEVGALPADPKVVPRSKSGAHTETHLTIASSWIDRPNEDPIIFAGNLALLGLDGNMVREIASLGQHGLNYTNYMHRSPSFVPQAPPTATLTVGYTSNGERFGDPHAVFNPWRQFVQVCGFIAISPEVAPDHIDVIHALRAVAPREA